MKFIPSLEQLAEARNQLPNPYALGGRTCFQVMVPCRQRYTTLGPLDMRDAMVHTLCFELEKTRVVEAGYDRELRQWVYHGPVRV